MIAVVYSGSNYADWRLADRGRTIASFKTAGINPYFNDEKQIIQLLSKNINLIHHAEEIKRIYFYGAGSFSSDLKMIVHNAFSAFFKFGRTTVEHDIDAAAIACCKNKPGIICIVGSGSNAAWYDGRRVKPNNYGLGFVLADEGSGNWLGRELLKAYMNETLPVNVKKKFEHRYDPDRRSLLEKVYRQKQPAVFLSSFADFFVDNKEDHYLKTVIIAGFNKLIHTYLLPLHKQHPGSTVNFTGTVAADFEEYLLEALAETNISIGNIVKEPINNLLTYYSNKN
jgi:glucosamine kinase